MRVQKRSQNEKQLQRFANAVAEYRCHGDIGVVDRTVCSIFRFGGDDTDLPNTKVRNFECDTRPTQPFLSE